MSGKHIITLAGRVDSEFLTIVRRPSRYIGGEINQVKKDLASCCLTVALCFPDIYEIAMSHTGLAIIYELLNGMDGVAAERAFAPWLDAEKILRQKNIPLFTLESKAALNSFDLIGFSLTNELCYTNVLNMLSLAGLNLRSRHRTDADPIVIAGGGMANCCEPLAEFIDLFVIGEGENAARQLADFIIKQKRAGASKKQILQTAAQNFDWVYVPAFYEFEYDGKRIKSFKPLLTGLPTRFKNAVVRDFENAPTPQNPIVPFAQAVHERSSVEIMRGCPGRCAFCQAGFCRRPLRYRSVEKILALAKASYHSTGFDTVGLLSLSTADYPNLDELMLKMHAYFRDKHVGLSLPSLRPGRHTKLLPQMAASVRKSGLTIAVEAASERLREIVNKPLKDEDLFAAVEAAYRAGWQKIKLYFMAGLPGETEDDIKQIVELSVRLARLRKTVDGRTGQINAAISWLVPKAHTPLGWLEQRPKSYFETARGLILEEKRKLRAKFIQFKFHNIERSILESAIGRGDRRLSDVIESAWRGGARFDLWDECFNYQLWCEAFAEFGFDLQTAAQRRFEADEVLPWEHLGGPGKKYLLSHLESVTRKLKS